MAHTLSAKKRMRQNVKRRARNHWRQARVKDAIRVFDEALHDGDTTKASDQLKTVYRELDKFAAKGTIHKNAASRKKARLAKRLAQAQA